MKKMKFKRAISLFLTMILTVSQFMNVGVEVKADEQTEGTWIATEYITNGDFETGDTSGWSIDFTSCDNGTSYIVKADEWASNNKTSFLKEKLWNVNKTSELKGKPNKNTLKRTHKKQTI